MASASRNSERKISPKGAEPGRLGSVLGKPGLLLNYWLEKQTQSANKNEHPDLNQINKELQDEIK
jgi:hypothetical protein